MISNKRQRRNFPIDFPHTIPINLVFNEEQYQKLILGLKPKEMENRWRIYFEDDTLYFLRSWTGYHVFDAKILKENDFYYIGEFLAERNPEKYKNTNDDYDINVISELITKILTR
jgi:ADP-ribosyl-[dinitrogen reductase] hydrolase